MHCMSVARTRRLRVVTVRVRVVTCTHRLRVGYACRLRNGVSQLHKHNQTHCFTHCCTCKHDSSKQCFQLLKHSGLTVYGTLPRSIQGQECHLVTRSLCHSRWHPGLEMTRRSRSLFCTRAGSGTRSPSPRPTRTNSVTLGTPPTTRG